MPHRRGSPGPTARWATVASLLVTLGACGDAPDEQPGGAAGVGRANGTVVRVVDGDTVEVRVGGTAERVRLIGVDTPETKRPDTPVECYGPEAAAFTERLVPAGTEVRLERDIENRDAYGRLLGYLYRSTDGIFVNYELVRQGYATPLTIEPNVAHAALFVEAARAAERGDAGLWSRCSG